MINTTSKEQYQPEVGFPVYGLYIGAQDVRLL